MWHGVFVKVIFAACFLLIFPAEANARPFEALRERVRERITERTDVQTEDSAPSIGGVEVSVWEPKATGPAPLVIFSHGFGGCPTQSRFLMEALAADGYLVIAPNHKDARCGNSFSDSGRARPEIPFGTPEDWSPQTYSDRRDDIVHLLNILRQEERWSARIDWSRMALAGHSLGGYTVLGLAGGWAQWKQPGIRAVLALSPYCAPYAEHHSLKEISSPVMYQGGMLDKGITPSIARKGGCYDQTPSPAAFVEFKLAGHFAWTNLNSREHDAITHYALSFLNHYVKGSADTSFARSRDGVATLVTK